MSKTCPDCQRAHSPDWVRATGPFFRDRKFQGRYTGQFFATRVEAMAAECQARQQADERHRAEDAAAEAYFAREYQRAMDAKAESEGRLDPGQPTATAHTDRREELTRPFAPGELTAAEIMDMRTRMEESSR